MIKSIISSHPILSGFSIFFVAVLVFVKVYSAIWLRHEIREGNELVVEIENYITTNGRPPFNLADIGYDKKYGIEYDTYHNDSLYVLFFPISAEENMYYYSDDRIWTTKWKNEDY